jgi:hypothetical protein
MSGSRVTRLAVLLGLVLAALDLAVSRRLTLAFDAGFVLLCVGAALAVRPRDFFRVGVLPPLLLLGFVTSISLVHRAWVADAADSLVQAVVSGLAHRANALLAAYVLTLGVLAMRQRVQARHRRTAAHRVARAEPAPPAPPAQAKREGSPAPTRVTSGKPSERSTTVVGSEPHSPESITASNQ